MGFREYPTKTEFSVGMSPPWVARWGPGTQGWGGGGCLSFCAAVGSPFSSEPISGGTYRTLGARPATEWNVHFVRCTNVLRTLQKPISNTPGLLGGRSGWGACRPAGNERQSIPLGSDLITLHRVGYLSSQRTKLMPNSPASPVLLAGRRGPRAGCAEDPAPFDCWGGGGAARECVQGCEFFMCPCQLGVESTEREGRSALILRSRELHPELGPRTCDLEVSMIHTCGTSRENAGPVRRC